MNAPAPRSTSSTPDSTFPRAARLLTPRDFAALRTGSRRFGGARLTAQIKPNDRDTARLGLAVSRRVSKLAVERNRIKRVARDSFRRHRAALGAFDILLIANPPASSADNAQLRADLEEMWRRIAALNAPEAVGTMRG